jgi:hypothetical protein
LRGPRLAALFIVAGLGCAASGPAFAPVAVPKDKALVYIYRPELGDGPQARFHVAVGDHSIVYLIRGGYFPYLSPPGEVEFWAEREARQAITENLRAGHTYYLRGSVSPGLFISRPELEFLPEETATPELEECVRLPPAED